MGNESGTVGRLLFLRIVLGECTGGEGEQTERQREGETERRSEGERG
jgi:hypothetical protein